MNKCAMYVATSFRVGQQTIIRVNIYTNIHQKKFKRKRDEREATKNKSRIEQKDERI